MRRGGRGRQCRSARSRCNIRICIEAIHFRMDADALDRFDWTLVRSFLAVLDAGSVTAAAQRSGARQPTLSRHVAELEAQLGAPLFERTGRGVMPTGAALAIAEAARRMAGRRARRRRAAWRRRARRPRGVVRVTTSQVAATWLLPPVLAALQRAHPEIEIELVASNELTNLLRREADIAVRMVRPAQSSLIAQEARRDRDRRRRAQELPRRRAAAAQRRRPAPPSPDRLRPRRPRSSAASAADGPAADARRLRLAHRRPGRLRPPRRRGRGHRLRRALQPAPLARRRRRAAGAGGRRRCRAGSRCTARSARTRWCGRSTTSWRGRSRQHCAAERSPRAATLRRALRRRPAAAPRTRPRSGGSLPRAISTIAHRRRCRRARAARAGARSVLASTTRTTRPGAEPRRQLAQLELAAAPLGAEAAQVHHHRVGARDQLDHGRLPGVVAAVELVDAIAAVAVGQDVHRRELARQVLLRLDEAGRRCRRWRSAARRRDRPCARRHRARRSSSPARSVASASRCGRTAPRCARCRRRRAAAAACAAAAPARRAWAQRSARASRNGKQEVGDRADAPGSAAAATCPDRPRPARRSRLTTTSSHQLCASSCASEKRLAS